MIQVVLKPDVFLNQDLLERETKNQEKYEKEKKRLVKFTEVIISLCLVLSISLCKCCLK